MHAHWKDTDDNGLYYFDGTKSKKLECDPKAYDALNFTSGPLSKEQQSAISILTGYNPQRASSKQHRFFVPSPLEIIEYGAEKVVMNIKHVRDNIKKKRTSAEPDNSPEIEMTRKDTPGNMSS